LVSDFGDEDMDSLPRDLVYPDESEIGPLSDKVE
jgi:hypothetical protein